MEAMALHLESSYEKLYRWSQGEPVIPLLEQIISVNEAFKHVVEIFCNCL